MEKAMLNISYFLKNQLSSGVKMLAKYIKRGISGLFNCTYEEKI